MPDRHTVNTEFGPLAVDNWLLKLWNTHGWPEDHVLKRMTEEQQAAETAPWTVGYHQFSAAERNPAVCICGLGPDAVVHNEPPHRFNTRTKNHQIPVHGICTDCHHHETAACHTTEKSGADRAES